LWKSRSAPESFAEEFAGMNRLHTPCASQRLGQMLIPGDSQRLSICIICSALDAPPLVLRDALHFLRIDWAEKSATFRVDARNAPLHEGLGCNM
jgi:hypothetical protein